MTFTLLTVLIFLILGLVVFRMTMKGYAQGFIRAGIGFVSIIFSLLISSLLSSFVFAKRIGNVIIAEFDLDSLLSDMSEQIGGNFDKMFSALITMVISSVMFLLIYFIFLFVCRLIISIVFKTALKADPNDVGFVGENDPWYRRNSNKLGAVIGGISGFLAMTICLSPIIGSLKTADKTITILENLNVVDADTVEGLDLVEKYSDDFGVTVLYYCGGKVVYDLGARTTVNGNTVILSREVKAFESISNDVMKLAENFSDIENVSAEDFRTVRDMCGKIEDSYFLSVLASDTLSSAANAWRMGEKFMEIEFPMSNETLDPVFDGVFSVFASSTYKTVASDLYTFVDICTLMIDSGLFDAGEDYDKLMAILEDGSVMDKLSTILEGNSRMASIKDVLYRTAMKTLVKTIKFDGYDVSEYEGLINNITDQFNRLQGQKDEKKVETLTDYAVQYISDYGVDVPESVAELVVAAMIKEIPADENGQVDPAQVSEFFDKYYTPVN